MLNYSKLAAYFFILFSSICIQSTVSDSKFSLCDKRNPHTNKVDQFRCPEDSNSSRIWFGSSNFFPSSNQDKRIFCCGNLENRFCCKKSQHKKELYIKQRSEYANQSRMGGLSVLLIVLAVFAILICICCRCISLCFKKKRMNHGVVISSPGTTGNIDGQNVHVISQPQYGGVPNQYPGANPYTPAASYQQQQYPGANQYPPAASYPYPPTSNYNQQQPNYNQSSYINQPPPQYSEQYSAQAYPNPYKQESSHQQSAHDKPPVPSAPEF